MTLEEHQLILDAATLIRDMKNFLHMYTPMEEEIDNWMERYSKIVRKGDYYV